MTTLKSLVLVGAGHANAQLLKHFIDHPDPRVSITVVTPTTLAPYSGMVPGWLSGAYDFSEICIDFNALARAANAALRLDEIASLDPDRQIARLSSGSELFYDVLAVNVGSTLRPPSLQDGRLLSLRPLGRLRNVWDGLLDELRLNESQQPLVVTAVGGGAAGIEAVLASVAKLRALQPGRDIAGRLVTRSSDILPGFPRRTKSLARLALQRCGISVVTNTEFTPEFEKDSDIVLWATGAQAHDWHSASGLKLSDRGFIQVDRYLRSVSHSNVFAVGDCAEWSEPLPKAGVYAVRMGPYLTHNVRVALNSGGVLREYRPQRHFLVLLATGDGRAIGSRGRVGLGASALIGKLMWRWKDHIDRTFIDQFRLEDHASAKTGRLFVQDRSGRRVAPAEQPRISKASSADKA